MYGKPGHWNEVGQEIGRRRIWNTLEACRNGGLMKTTVHLLEMHPCSDR